MASVRRASDELYARRRELYARAAAVFRRSGYRGTTLKALAGVCGLSIPALYRYFPSKKAFALFPLAALYPELHASPPDPGDDAAANLNWWVEAAAMEMPNYTLALRLANEVGLSPEERRTIDANLSAHVAFLSAIARRAAPRLDERTAQELAGTMISITVGPATTGLPADPASLRRQLRTLLRAYGVALPGMVRSAAR